MAQTDSQRSDSEDPESSNIPSDLPESQIDGWAVEKGPLSEDESFQSSVGDMLDSIDSDSSEGEISGGGNGDAMGAESEEPTIDPSDELLIRAGSILNGGETDIPEPEEEAELVDEDADGLIDFPDPQSLLAEVDNQDQELKEEDHGIAESSEVEPLDSEEGLVSVPDLQSLMKEASDDVQIHSDRDPGPEFEGPAIEFEDKEKERSLKEEFQGDEDSKEEAEEPAERNAEPFTSELADDDLEEIVVAEMAESDEKAEPKQEATVEPEARDLEESSQGNDPAADAEDDLLSGDDAGDDLFLDSEDGFSISDDDDIGRVAVGFGGGPVDTSRAEPERLSQVRKYITWPAAASLVLIGLSILGASFKDTILDLLAHGNVRETRIHLVVAKMTDEVFNSVKPGRPYDLAWIESEIQRVSDSEYRVAAKIGVTLEEDLYSPLEDSYFYSLLPFSKAELEEATAFADDSSQLPADLQSPSPRWVGLYRKDGKKGEVFDFDAHYRITAKGDQKGGWELSNLRINGSDDGLAWASMLPKSEFEEGSIEVDAMEFEYYLKAFEKAGLVYLEKARAFEKNWIASRSEKAERLQKLRQEITMSLSQGSYFKGVAILGETSEETRDISLIVTETRGEGELIKGLLKLEGEKVASPKHFTGFLDIIEKEEDLQGRLELTTVAFPGQPHDTAELAFFKPGTVSRIQMNTDGRSLEGDSESISLRLMRGR